MKLLYQASIAKRSLADVCASFEEFSAAPERVREFALSLANGVFDNQSDIDGKISEALDKWEFDRLAAVDLQLMRVAAYEIMFSEDIPVNVTIDEAIELAREYSTEHAAKFVNGVLDALARKNAPHKIEGNLK